MILKEEWFSVFNSYVVFVVFVCFFECVVIWEIYFICGKGRSFIVIDGVGKGLMLYFLIILMYNVVYVFLGDDIFKW